LVLIFVDATNDENFLMVKISGITVNQQSCIQFCD